MRSARRASFYLVMALYAAYNTLWLTGTMFSYGKSDTPREALYFTLTFLADIPAFFVISRKLNLGLALFCLLLVTSLALAASEHILNGFSLLYWYAPKLLPLAIAGWVSKSSKGFLPLDTRGFRIGSHSPSTNKGP
jgi:hypothetical protein